ncbi:MAG: hypothetical protein AAB410_00320 [Patescibacteria group bacterium]
MLIIFLLFALLMLFIISSAFFGFLITRVPFVPTGAGDIKFIVEKLGITPKDIFYDLGSGDGKVCLLINRLSGARCVGFELTTWTYLLSLIKSTGNHRLKFRHSDFFEANWSEASYVYGYLYPPLMGRVKEKFLKDCKPGSIAIIRDFPFPDLKPSEVFYMPKAHEIYLYRL